MADRDAKNKYAYLDQLTTEELQELLRVDIDSPVSSDDEAIFYILEVIEKRGCADPSVSFPDLGKSWKEFNELYNTAEATGASLYPADLEKHHTQSQEKSSPIKPGKKARTLRRCLLVAAILVCLVAALTIPVSGYANIFQMIGQWSAEQFGFKVSNTGNYDSYETESNNSTATVGADLQNIMIQNGITEPTVPKWIPEGFELLDDISVYEFASSGNLQIDATYSDGTDIFAISCIRHNSQIYDTFYEKDNGEVEIYIAGGTEHYIFSNLKSYTAAWCTGNLECSISTTLPKSDLEKAIDSIYEE